MLRDGYYSITLPADALEWIRQASQLPVDMPRISPKWILRGLLGQHPMDISQPMIKFTEGLMKIQILDML